MARRSRRALALVVVAVALAAVFAPAASADGDNLLIIRRFDSSEPSGRENAEKPKDAVVDFIWTGNASDASGAKIQQDGNDMSLTSPAKPFTGPKGMVIVVDSSPQMDNGGGLAAARASLNDFIISTLKNDPNMQFAVVQAGDTANLKVDFTNDVRAVTNAIQPIQPEDPNAPRATGGIGPTNKTAIWAALKIAGAAFSDPNARGHRLQPNILFVTGGVDTVSDKDEPVGRTSVLTAGATMFVVERTDQGADDTSVNDLVARTGGKVYQIDGPNKFDAPIKAAGDIVMNKQYTLSYGTNLKGGTSTNVLLTVGGQTTNAAVNVGGVAQGGQQVRPDVISTSTSLPFLTSPATYAVALLLVLVSASMLAYGVTTMFVRDELSNVLQPYADAYGGGDDEGSSAVAKSALIQRAVELTEQVASNQGMLSRAEGALERANLPLRAGEALFFYSLLVGLLTIVGLVLFRNIFGGLILGGLGAMLPVGSVNFIAGRRRKAFMSQLPDTLQLLSGTLRAGYSLMQGVEAVSQEVDDPMGLELRRVVTEARLGRPLEESLEASAERMDSPDFAWAVMAIRIQREVGGNLSELLMTVADTMVARERLRRDVAALTAEGRVSAAVLGALPAGLGVLMYMLNPEYVGVLFSDGLGIGMLITAVIAMLIGFFWMKKLINIEI